MKTLIVSLPRAPTINSPCFLQWGLILPFVIGLCLPVNIFWNNQNSLIFSGSRFSRKVLNTISCFSKVAGRCPRSRRVLSSARGTPSEVLVLRKDRLTIQPEELLCVEIPFPSKSSLLENENHSLFHDLEIATVTSCNVYLQSFFFLYTYPLSPPSSFIALRQ